MKFKFLGKPDLFVDTLTTDNIYTILQFEHTPRYILVYVIDNENQVLCIPYRSMRLFNQNWGVVEND